jgi:hypothetical protein
MMIGVTRDEVLKRCAEFSGQLSTQCRTVSIGLLAFAWALMTSKDSPLIDQTTRMLDASRRWQLVGISCVAIGALVADLIQYYAGLRVERKVLKKFDDAKSNDDRRTYDVTPARKVQDGAFYTKLIGLGIAVVWLLGLLAWVWLRW